MKKRKRVMAKLHNAFLWGMTYSAFMLFIVSVSSLDSDSWIPYIGLLLSMMWLTPFALVNEDRWEL